MAIELEGGRRPRVLVSNDDGVGAPGLRALAAAIAAAGFADLLVCGPASEQSAQSHSITLARALKCVPIDIAGATEAFAVEGSPADSVMLALNSPVFQDRQVDLVVSGINRGDNAGLHVIYSGTVGAAREAACKGVPAIAISLAAHRVTDVSDYEVAARYCVPLIQAMLQQVAGGGGASTPLSGYVLNVNVPSCSFEQLRGYYMTRQGMGCVYPRFQEVRDADAEARAAAEATARHAAAVAEGDAEPDADAQRAANTAGLGAACGAPRFFRNRHGHVQLDLSEGSDSWALANQWVSVSPLGLLSALALPGEEQSHVDKAAVASTTQALAAAAAQLGVALGGQPQDGRL